METNNKLREALKLCIDEMCNRCRANAALQGNPMPCINGCEAVRKAKAALAEPIRNCERFRNADEALEALERHCNSSGNGCIRCPVAGSSTNEVECKIAWLFAPATEKEGGNNAD